MDASASGKKLWNQLRKKSFEMLGKNADDPNAAAELKHEASEAAKDAAKKVGRGAFKVSAGAFALHRKAKKFLKQDLAQMLEAEGQKALDEGGAKAKNLIDSAKGKNEKAKRVIDRTEGWMGKVKEVIPHKDKNKEQGKAK
jgi:hypothetical protein